MVVVDGSQISRDCAASAMSVSPDTWSPPKLLSGRSLQHAVALLDLQDPDEKSQRGLSL